MVRRRHGNVGKVIGGVLVIAAVVFGLWYFGLLPMNVQQGQPVTGLYVTVRDTPDSSLIAGATVNVYADAGCTELLASGTTQSNGVATIYGSFTSGQVVYIQASLTDYYISPLVEVVIPAPDANSMASIGAIEITDMYTSADVTMTMTADNGTAIISGSNISATGFTGFTLRTTGIATGESQGTVGYKTVFSGIEKKTIVTGCVVRIAVTGGSINWATTPDYTVTLGSVINYIWILEGEANSAYDATDGIWTVRLALASTAPNAISDIDIYLYCDGDDLDNTITLEDVQNGAFAGYTPAEAITNLDII